MHKNNIALVFGAYINPKANWQKLISLQLEDVKRSGVLDAADLHVIVTNHLNVDGVEEFFQSLDVTVHHLAVHTQNAFEFHALKHLWNLAQFEDRYKMVAYFHTKGMSYAKNKRNRQEDALTHYTFKHWRKIYDILSSPGLNLKIGLLPSPPSSDHSGVMWFNFWWASTSYIRTLPDPELTADRFYYEHWIGMTSLPYDPSGYSRCLITFGEHKFDHRQGPDGLQILRRNRKFPYLGYFMHYSRILFGKKRLI